MLKSHEITEVVQCTHSLLWDNGISASTASKEFNVSRYIVVKRASSDEWENWVEII